MDREMALEAYKKAALEKSAAFRNFMSEFVLEHADDLEELVKTAVNNLSKQIQKQKKESICFLYFSVLRIDLLQKKYRVLLLGLDGNWYLDKQPAEVYTNAEWLFEPFEKFCDSLTALNHGYGVFINEYDIHALLFDELKLINNMICQVLRYRLRDWEKKEIFKDIPLALYWNLNWGEYRDKTELLIQTDRSKKEESVWKEALLKAAKNEENMVFSYWYEGTYENEKIKELDLRFITFEKSVLKNITFEHCNLEGSRFIETDFSECKFENCNLWGADFRKCTFQKASFSDSCLTGAAFPAESIPFLEISAKQLQEICLDREEME